MSALTFIEKLFSPSPNRYRVLVTVQSISLRKNRSLEIWFVHDTDDFDLELFEIVLSISFVEGSFREKF